LTEFGWRDEFEVQGSSSLKEQGAEPLTWFVAFACGTGNVATYRLWLWESTTGWKMGFPVVRNKRGESGRDDGCILGKMTEENCEGRY
jgi:hypothetical protein